jgi:DNA-binding beta-propeller fold protein YncE
MVSVQFGVTDRAFRYSHTIGRTSFFGDGFRHPMDVEFSNAGVLYVLSRSRQDRPNGVRITVCTVDEDYITQFGSFGEGDGQFVWPISLALSQNEKVYVADQWLNRITVFDQDGEFVAKWGVAGRLDGQMNHPFGMVFDHHDNLLIVDSRNHRVQRFSNDGTFIDKWGEFGSGPGQFDLPWGITVDHLGQIYVADWNNHRVQKFTSNGKFLAAFGSHGTGAGQFHRPSGVAVDGDGDIYVADWGNHRVQVLTASGRHISTFYGDGTLSKWGERSLEANPDKAWQRGLVRDREPERRFWNPVSVRIDANKRILVADCMRHRIQVYQKAYI